MTGWRRVAEELRRGEDSGDERDNRDKTPIPSLARDPLVTVKQWRSNLAGLHLDRPTWGRDRLLWRELFGDANWLVDHFGQQAVREGYTNLR